MMWKTSVLVALAALCGSSEALADDSATCGSNVTRANVALCAVKESLAVAAQKQATEAAKAREVAAEPVLPSAPVASVSVAHRTPPGISPVWNWSAMVSQEVEVAGQSSARKRAASEGVVGEAQRSAALEREVALSAWRAYFEALGSAEALRQAKQVEALAGRVEASVTASGQVGLTSGMDVELASARALQATQARLSAERSVKAAGLALAALWGKDGSKGLPVVEGSLTPLSGVEEFVAKATPKPAVQPPLALALEADKRALQAKADELRRDRVPNITLSVFVQNDGVNELVIGGGISIPIPLPQPLGTTNAGQIAEAEALAQKAGVEAEAARRSAKSAVAVKVSEYTSRKAEVETFSAERLSRAEKSLTAMAVEIEAGRLSVKDAAQAQQALIEVLAAHGQAQKALCLASVEVVAAAGLPIEGSSK